MQNGGKDIFIELLEKTGDKFSNRDMVLQLATQDITDYERGKIMGKIEMLTYLMGELAGGDDEAETISGN